MTEHRLSKIIVRIDGVAATISAVILLLGNQWLSQWYLLPVDLLVFMGQVSVLYAAYSLTLTMINNRPMYLIIWLVLGNLIWAFCCIWWIASYFEQMTIFGIIHLIFEAIFVSSLATLEWRWRHQLSVYPMKVS